MRGQGEVRRALRITGGTHFHGNYMSKILDTTSGNECKAFVKVTLSSVYGYEYEPCLICEEYTTNKDFCNLGIYKDL